ncbi:MAG: RMD1 family protein [Hyphomicrobium sp.]|jgi:uncharacterized Rmd1/YagE family protein
MNNKVIHVRALQLGERIEVKGLEREDAFSVAPLAFRTSGDGIAVLFKSGAAVFIGMNPVDEEQLILGLADRIIGPLEERETETMRLIVKPEEDGLLTPSGDVQIKVADANRLLLVAEALAMSVVFAYDERRLGAAFERIDSVAQALKDRRLPVEPQGTLLEQIGEALLIQQRLAARVDLDEKPDVLWDHPELERFWARLVEEYDLTQRGRAISRKLEVIRGTTDTLTDLFATRTSHRLEWYIIALIGLEIVLSMYDHFLK